MFLFILLIFLSTAYASEKIVVLEIQGIGLNSNYRIFLSDEVRSGILNTAKRNDIDVLTQENITEVLKDNAMKMEDCVASCEVETARNLQADYVISGKMTKLEGFFLLYLKMHETKGARLIAAKKIKAKSEIELSDKLASFAELMFQEGLQADKNSYTLDSNQIEIEIIEPKGSLKEKMLALKKQEEQLALIQKREEERLKKAKETSLLLKNKKELLRKEAMRPIQESAMQEWVEVQKVLPDLGEKFRKEALQAFITKYKNQSIQIDGKKIPVEIPQVKQAIFLYKKGQLMTEKHNYKMIPLQMKDIPFKESIKGTLHDVDFPSKKVTFSYTQNVVIGTTEVTEGLYRDVMGRKSPAKGDENIPMNVSDESTFDILVFLNRLSKKENLTPCFIITKERYRSKKYRLQPSCTGYRLPTDHEIRKISKMNALVTENFNEYGYFNFRYTYRGREKQQGNSDGYLQEVASKKSIRGLYDTIGNACELFLSSSASSNSSSSLFKKYLKTINSDIWDTYLQAESSRQKHIHATTLLSTFRSVVAPMSDRYDIFHKVNKNLCFGGSSHINGGYYSGKEAPSLKSLITEYKGISKRNKHSYLGIRLVRLPNAVEVAIIKEQIQKKKDLLLTFLTKKKESLLRKEQNDVELHYKDLASRYERIRHEKNLDKLEAYQKEIQSLLSNVSRTITIEDEAFFDIPPKDKNMIVHLLSEEKRSDLLLLQGKIEARITEVKNKIAYLESNNIEKWVGGYCLGLSSSCPGFGLEVEYIAENWGLGVSSWLLMNNVHGRIYPFGVDKRVGIHAGVSSLLGLEYIYPSVGLMYDFTGNNGIFRIEGSYFPIAYGDTLSFGLSISGLYR